MKMHKSSKYPLPDGDISSALTLSSKLKFRPHMCRKVFTLRQFAESGRRICSTREKMKNKSLNKKKKKKKKKKKSLHIQKYRIEQRA